MIRVGGYCPDWGNKAAEHYSLFKSSHFILWYKNNNLILETMHVHTVLYRTVKLKFSCRWAAFGNRPK